MRAEQIHLLAFALVLIGCSGTPELQSFPGPVTMETEVDWGFLTLGPNDVIRVTVQNHPELSSVIDGVRIDPQGSIILPELGAVSLRGLTIVEANELLQDRYGDILRRPNVTAEVIDYRSRSFYVLGHFGSPGLVFMDRPMNALEASAMGGALLRGADREEVYLLRPHADRIEVHRFNLQAPGRAGLVQVRPGDIIYARPTGAWNFQDQLLPILAGMGVNIRNIVETPLIK